MRVGPSSDIPIDDLPSSLFMQRLKAMGFQNLALLMPIIVYVQIGVNATVDLSCQVQRTISQPVTGQPQCPDSNTQQCTSEIILCSCFGKGATIEWQHTLFSDTIDFLNTGSTMVGAQERDVNTGASAVVTAVNPRDNITTDLTLNVTTTTAVNASQFNNTAIRCQDTSGPPGGMEQTLLMYAPPPAPTITGVRFTVGVSFTVEWRETPGSCETVDGFTFNVTPNDLSCTSSSMTTVTCSYNRAHLGQTYTVTVAALNCDTQRGNEDSITINLQAPNPPTLIVTPVYDSSGSLLEIKSQASEGAPVDISEGFVDGSVVSYTLTYNDGSGSLPPVVVPSANCNGGVCEHVFYATTNRLPSSYTVSMTATNVVGEGPATTSQLIRTQNSDFQANVLANNSVLCLLNGQPAASCSIRYGADPTYRVLPNTDSAATGGVITLTSTLTGDTTYYIVSTTTGSLTTELRGSFNMCTTQDLFTPNTIVRPQSSCGEPTGYVHLACYSGVTPGSIVVYHCAAGSLSRQPTRTCRFDGTWSGTTPNCVCNASLTVPPTVENAMVSVVVSADSRRATATYSCTGIYTISGSQTLTFDCNVAPHMWNPTFTLCTVSVGAAVAISVFLSFMVSFAAGAFLAALLTYYCHVTGRKKSSGQPHLTASEGLQPAPVYEEVKARNLEIKENPSYEVGTEMKKNVSYGPLEH